MLVLKVEQGGRVDRVAGAEVGRDGLRLAVERKRLFACQHRKHYHIVSNDCGFGTKNERLAFVVVVRVIDTEATSEAT